MFLAPLNVRRVLLLPGRREREIAGKRDEGQGGRTRAKRLVN